MNRNFLGDLHLYVEDSSTAPRRIKVFATNGEISEENILGIKYGGMSDYEGIKPEYYHNPNTTPLNVEFDNKPARLKLYYKDSLQKRNNQVNAYQVTIQIAYVAKHPDIEALNDPQRIKEAYDRAISNAISGAKSQENELA